MAVIRRASFDDVDAMAAVQHRAALTGFAHIFPPEAPPPTIEQLAHEWKLELDALGRGAAFVAVDGDDIVGTAVAVDDGAGVGHLRRIYVVPDRWADGIGAALYDAALAQLRAMGLRTATLWVLRDNDRARAMYERRGWVVDPGGRTRSVWQHIDDVLYVLDTLDRS
jgi:GNAT superfamily N-acetyltransferase